MLVVGSLLWLAGLYFSTAIVGLLGAAAGLLGGLAVSYSLNLPAEFCSAAGAVLLGLVLILLKKTVLMLLATLVFALFGTIIYYGLTPRESAAGMSVTWNTAASLPANYTPPSAHLAGIHQFTEDDASIPAKLHLFFKDALQTVNLHQPNMLLAAMSAGIIGLLAGWSLQKPVMALCCSGIGTCLVVIGLDLTLLGMNIHLPAWFQQHPENLSMICLSLVVFGMMVQLLTLVSSKRPKRIHT